MDTSPLRKLLEEMINKRPIKRQFIVGASDIKNNQFIRFSNDSFKSTNDFIDILMGSTAVPGIFPFQEYKDYVLVDGGTMKFFEV